MRLFEAIINANHRAVQGDHSAGLRPAEYADELPLVALSCVDPRLNPLLPEVLGIPEDQFIWLRNAGNIITSTLSSTMRSICLACLVKGGQEIVIIGHTDCLVAKCTAFQLIERLRQMGVERHVLPDNFNEFFGMFGSERQNVIKAAEYVRKSPLIGSKIPVHGVIVDTDTGRLEWLVNGYETIGTAAGPLNHLMESANQAIGKFQALGELDLGNLKIGEAASQIQDWAKSARDIVTEQPGQPPSPPQAQPPPIKIPMPPPMKPKLSFKRTRS